MKADLDRLLTSLRDTTPDHPRLPELEQRLSQHLAAAELPHFWQKFGLHVQVTAVLGAFLWGILIGTQGIFTTSPTSGPFLIEPAEFLAPDDTRF